MLASSDDLARGVTFGGYVVHERIGRGGMATVYRAEHVLLEKPVALKVMDRSLLEAPAGLQRFLQEGRAAASIKHPNVVDITDVGVHQGVPYLVMELLTGEDLESHLRKQQRLDSSATIRLALPVAAALHAAHGSGVVHRDIKPSNIFLSIGPDEQVVPKVLDFGISRMSFDRASIERMPTPRDHLIGTPQYLAPEALRGPGAMGPLSDQYSFGLVLYQCVTGRTPFTGETVLALLEALARGTFAPPRAVQPDVSVGLERVILRALSRDPQRRFPSVREMGRALIELAAERTQTVWGQSFATQPLGRTRALASDAGPAPRLTLQSDFTLQSEGPGESLRASPRRRRAVGVALVLGGTLAAAVGAASFAPRPAALELSSTPLAAKALTPEREVTALQPSERLREPAASRGAAAPPHVIEAAPRSLASARGKASLRAARVRKAQLSTSAQTNKAAERAPSSTQTSTDAGPVGSPIVSPALDAATPLPRPPAKVQPGAGAPMKGANGAPLLD